MDKDIPEEGIKQEGVQSDLIDRTFVHRLLDELITKIESKYPDHEKELACSLVAGALNGMINGL